MKNLIHTIAATFSNLRVMKRVLIKVTLAVVLLGSLFATSANAAVALVGSPLTEGHNIDNGGSNIVVTVPLAHFTTVGHLIFLAVAVRDPGNTAGVMELPVSSGSPTSLWVKQIEINPEDPNNGNDKGVFAIFTKIADANDLTAHTITVQNESGTGVDGKETAVSVLQFSGVDQSNPFNSSDTDRSSQGGSGDDDEFPAPSVTAAVTVPPIVMADSQVVRAFFYRDRNFDNAGQNEEIIDGTTSITEPITEIPGAEVHGRKTNDQAKVSLEISLDNSPSSATNVATAQSLAGDDKEWGAATIILQPSVPAPVMSIVKTSEFGAGGISHTQYPQYRIFVENTGDLVANNVVITDEFLAPSTFVFDDINNFFSVTLSGGATGPTSAGNSGSPSIPEFKSFIMPAGSSVQIDFEADVPESQAGGTYHNQATVSSTSGDFTDVVYDGSGTGEDVTINAPGLTFDKTTTTTDILDNSDLATFVLTVTSTGTQNANNVVITDTLPSGLTFAAVTATVKSDPSVLGDVPAVNDAPGTPTIPVFDGYTIPPGESLTITYTASVDVTALSGTYSNSASVVATDVTAIVDSVNVEVCAQSSDGILNVVDVDLLNTIEESDETDNQASLCTIKTVYDYGDLPTGYGTLTADNGPVHLIDSRLYLGTIPDQEANGVESADAKGDDDVLRDDEDGIAFGSPGGGAHAEIHATATVGNPTNLTGTVVCGWLDVYDSNGDASGALIAQDSTDTCESVDSDDLTFIWSNLPLAAGFTYARFRVCESEADCGDPLDDGGGQASAPIGEVEDYRIDFDFLNTTAVTIGDVSLESISLLDLFKALGLEGLTRDELLELLAGFNESLAASLQNADIVEILQALMSYLDPDGDGNTAMFKWETLYQHGTIGFYAERDSGDGEWERVNEKLLPAMLSPLGGEYILIDPVPTSGNRYRYMLIENEAKGDTLNYGPYDLEMP